MNKIIYILLFSLILLGNAYAQESKLLVLKDRGIIVKSYVSGSYINFELSNHQWIKGYVNWIKTDSVQVKMFTLRQTTTVYGTWGEDTLKLGPLTIHVNEIISFPHDPGHYTSAWLLGKWQANANPNYRPIGKRFSVETI